MRVRAFFITVVLLAFPCIGQAQTNLAADVMSLNTPTASSGNQLDMGGLSISRGLVLIPYYVRFQFSPINYTTWGIQVYTNNNPSHAWTSPDGLCNGLRGRTDPLTRIPLYWQVYDAPQCVTTTAGGLGFYDDTLKYWGLVRDRNDDDIVNVWDVTTNLKERTFVDNRNLGNYPIENRLYHNPPVYLYLAMDIRGVKQTQQFGTTLNVDFYTLAVDLSHGGYATPNPFTPGRGQKTFFNFELNNLNSTFVIRIYTIRGRLIKTETRAREWDGRNDHGQIVEGGLYIYQIEAEGKRVSGSVVLIK